MSEIVKKEYASFLKWIGVIFVASIAFSLIAPRYEFRNRDGKYVRMNKVSGTIDMWDFGIWTSESEMRNESLEYLASEAKEKPSKEKKK